MPSYLWTLVYVGLDAKIKGCIGPNYVDVHQYAYIESYVTH